MLDTQKPLSVQGLQYAVNELADLNVQTVQLADLVELCRLCLQADAGEVADKEVWKFIEQKVKR
jgi:hypothetical protein